MKGVVEYLIERDPHEFGGEGVSRGFLAQKDPAGPLMIMIGIHAPIFFIDRDNPSLSKWVAILEESRQKNLVVRFTYDLDGQRLTSVELKK